MQCVSSTIIATVIIIALHTVSMSLVHSPTPMQLFVACSMIKWGVLHASDEKLGLHGTGNEAKYKYDL